MQPQKSKLYYMKYELVDSPGEFLEISTTRPETLMGDTAVAVNPDDERFRPPDWPKGAPAIPRGGN